MQKSVDQIKKDRAFGPKIKDFDNASENLIKLKIQLQKIKNEESKYTLSEQLRELEELYENIKIKMGQSAHIGEQTILDLKLGFVNAWEELKKSIDQAKRRLDSHKDIFKL